jgi:hypothetical protein
VELPFYKRLNPITQFEAVTEPSSYQPVPEEWSLVLSDIQGSTKAIEAGKYKEVNLIGAATIAAIQNVIGTRQFPFVFGGDGATALLPAEAINGVRKALLKLQRHAADQFGLQLRIGIVPVREVYKRGGKILIAKYQLGPNNFLAMFQGGGLQLAENILKKHADGALFLLVPDASSEPPDLESLSCRWAPIENRNGMMLSILVQALDLERANAVYRSILGEFYPVFNTEVNRPVSLKKMRLEEFGKSLRREMALRQDLGRMGILIKIVIPMIAVRIASWLPFFPFAGLVRRYLRDTLTLSDYKKLDDTLRMVLDCSAGQADKLEAILRKYHNQGSIAYGINRSRVALMTCIMEGLGQDEHVHFIDGGDGGYAMAAKGMKAQLQTMQTESPGQSQQGQLQQAARSRAGGEKS